MPCKLAHAGDFHLDEDHYFGDTAHCLEWFVEDAIRASVNFFCINGDLTTYKATIKERNFWIDMLIRMADHAPVIVVAGNHGAELENDLYVYSRAKSNYAIQLCEEPEFIEFDQVSIAVFPYPRKSEFVGGPQGSSLAGAFVEQLEEFNERFDRRPNCFRLFFGHFGVAGAR